MPSKFNTCNQRTQHSEHLIIHKFKIIHEFKAKLKIELVPEHRIPCGRCKYARTYQRSQQKFLPATFYFEC